MTFVKTRDLAKYEGKEVTLKGWVYQIRDHGKIMFYFLRDGYGFCQITIKKNIVGEDNFKTAKEIYREASVIISGTVKKDARAEGGFEVLASTVRVWNPSHPQIDQEVTPDSGPDIMLDKRHFVIRGRRTRAILKYRSDALRYFREYFYENDLFEVTPPLIVETLPEGGSDLFEIKYFEKKAYLSQSSQLYLEAAIFSLGNVFTILPSYRAEKSRTKRHLSEYTHVEAELSWVDFDDLTDFMQEMLIYVIKRSEEDSEDVFSDLDIKPFKPKTPFEKVPYKKALEIVRELGWEIEDGEDISDAPERDLVAKYGNPIYLTEFPVNMKPFYHKISEKDPSVTLSADLLVPVVGELIGSGERETDLNSLLTRLKAMGLNPDPYYWYTDLRKYGSVPHSGFGLGFERFVQWVLQVEHIRDTTLFPRTRFRLRP